MAKLNADGKLNDSFKLDGSKLSFNPFNTRIDSFLILANNQLVVGGYFQENIGYNNLVRLNPDGAIDFSFIGGRYGYGIYSLALTKTHKILLGGDFSQIVKPDQTVMRSHIARLNFDGSVDETFVTLPGPDGLLMKVYEASNGQVYIGGLFHNINGVHYNGFARLKGDAPLLSLAQPSWQPLKGFGFKITGSKESQPLTVQLSTNLSTWINLTNITASGGAMEFNDLSTNSNLSKRFYRVIAR